MPNREKTSVPLLDAGAAFRRFENVMRKLVRVPKKEVDEKIAAERAAKDSRKLA